MPSKFLFVSYDGLIGDIAWQVTKEGHAAKYYIEHAEEREIADGLRAARHRLARRGRLGRRHRLRRRAGARHAGRGLRARGQARRRRHAVHRQARGRPRHSASRSSRPPASRSSRSRTSRPSTTRSPSCGEPEPLRDQAERRGAEPKRPAVRRRGGRRARRHPGAGGLQARLGGPDQGVPAAAAHPRRRGGDGRVLQRRASSSTRSASTSSTRSSSPATSAPRPARWARPCSGASPTRSSTRRSRRWSRSWREERYVGYIDVNCIVNSNGIYPLEFTARFGYPTISIQQEGLLTPMGELLQASPTAR